MTIELDHLFICVATGAPEAEALLEFGLTEGTPNIHPGQGTQNRRFFFHNAMLELLWAHDETEARSPLVSPLRLWERWRYRETGHCPFGICFRPASPQPTLPFDTWAYRPPYLPEHLHIPIAVQAHPGEPLLFYLSFGSRPDQFPPERQQPLQHGSRWQEISAVHVTLPQTQPLSVAAQAVQQAGLVIFKTGLEYLLELEFDQGRQAQQVDFQPRLPLRCYW